MLPISWRACSGTNKVAAFKISPSQQRIDPALSLIVPWQGVDVISGNCPRHAGVRLNRVNDEMFVCPKGGEQYAPKGSINNQTNRDNYYLGLVLKGPGVMPRPGKV
jgi:hypothetical protein